ncbi:MAG: amidohydrolase [Anaerovoracaceae bacterium]|nr:amidohydrolase [Anaerovoracaceae bacterium]
MLFSNITILNDKMQTEQNKYVLVSGDRIAYIGDDKPDTGYLREYDGEGKLLMCGFYNGHGHSPMSLMRGYGENMALQDWLFKKIFPFEDKLDSEAVYWGTMLSMAESLRYGIVSTSDMYYFCDDMAHAVMESGAKANISRSVTNPTGMAVSELVSFREMKSFYDNFHNKADGRIKVDMSLHAEYTSNPETAMALAEYACSLDETIMHIHVSETSSEHEECIKRHGLTPAAYLEKMGLFDVPAIAAHCVYSDEDDLDIFKAKGVTVASNPVSNMKLASGICDIQRIIDKGINLSIGTDSVASNNSLDFMEEMKVMAIGCKISAGDPAAGRPEDILRAATAGGAKAQGRMDCGILREGNKADLIVLDISQANMHPVHSIVNNLVYSCSGKDVVLTMVDGKVLYDDGEYTTIDVEKTIYQAELSTKKILERL